MKHGTQAQSNPFPYSDSNKRYYTYDYYLKQTFGGKCVKIPLDGGMTCPNRDGTCGTGGCIYCSGRGSGDFAASPLLSVREQYEEVRARMGSKWPTDRCIPYFQAHTNTYAAPERLRRLYEAALSLPGAVGLNIATRADCLPDAVLNLLAETSEKTVLTVELGLQTTNDATAARIGRGHTFADFVDGYERLRQAVPHARIGVHLIFGLPGETQADMLATVRQVAALAPDEVKLHSLYVLRGTPLAERWQAGDYVPMTQGDYVETVVRALALLPPTTVIGRLTGDGEAKKLLAPLWSRRKIAVLNEIDKLLYQTDTWQGKEHGI